MVSPEKVRAFARSIYHWLPVPLHLKWRLRERLLPLLTALQNDRSFTGLCRALAATLQNADVPSCDHERERALACVIQAMAEHARVYGPVTHWIALPFLSTGGAEMVALNYCRALRELRPAQSVLLLITDRNLVSESIVLPTGVLKVVLGDHLLGDQSEARKQALLRDMLIAVRPHCFHNINSVVAWHLILEEGERLQRFTHLFASIFAFQFAENGNTKIGYAAYYLKKSLPFLSGLLSDNQRFVNDATAEYHLTPQEQARMRVLYQPCRLFSLEPGYERLAQRRTTVAKGASRGAKRPQVLWAGRLDAEKRVDLFLGVVRRCTFADFRVFGQVVLDQGAALPHLPNLSYEGPFSSPLEWTERFDFDAFVFTSRWEGMPNTLLEVGALGIPVIAPTVGGVIELITEATGFPLSERPTVADYELALRSVISDPVEALQRSDRLFDLVMQQHGWESFVEGVAAIPEYFGSVMADQAIEATQPATCVTEVVGMPLLPLVSVIIPCYNQGRYLQESVASALTACQHPLEIIVVDDGSTDKNASRHLLEAEQLAPEIVRIHFQENRGLSGARNKGIALARGQYVQFLDADDVLVPGKIDAQIAQLQVNPNLSVSICNFLICDDTRTLFSKPEEAIARFDLTEQDFLYRWERGFCIPIHCGLFRRGLLEKVSFDTHLRAKEDWLFWTLLAMEGVSFGYIHGHWAIYRQHEESMRYSHVNMGRAWLQAGLKLDAKLAGRELLFFESVVSWFEQGYRSQPSYRDEIAQMQVSSSVLGKVSPDATIVADLVSQVRPVADAILAALTRLHVVDQPPLISVVVPIYDHFECLQGCLESLARQGDVPIEIVCIDDGSPDPRIKLLMQLLQDRNPRLKVRLESTNQGISVVQNVAVDMALGKYVAFLDCDDELVSGALHEVRLCLEAHPEVDYLFTDRIDVDHGGEIIRIARYGGYDNLYFSNQEQIAADLIDGMVASHLKVIRRCVYQSLGGCDDVFSGVQDWELALRISKMHQFHYLARSLYRHRVHSGSVTRSDDVSQMRKTNQVRRLYLEAWREPTGNVRSVRVFRSPDLPESLDMLKTAWKQGELCVADARGMINLGQINFLREFNSYFERILWSDPQVPAALYGYLCKETVLTNDDQNDNLFLRAYTNNIPSSHNHTITVKTKHRIPY